MGRLTVILLFLLGTTSIASGMTPDQILWPTSLLANDQFIANDSDLSVTLYDFKGTPIHRFLPGSGKFRWSVITPDEKYLLIASDNGSLQLFDVQTGITVWSKSPAETGLSGGYQPSFSADGRSAIVPTREQALMLNTLSGGTIKTLRIDNGQKSRISAAALSPDGSKAALVDAMDQTGPVYTFDTRLGNPIKTAVTGAPLIRYSSDGRYFVLPAGKFNQPSRLRVVDTAASISSYVDVGQPLLISDIYPTRDGKFLLTVREYSGSGAGELIGELFNPATLQIVELWRRGDAEEFGQISFDLNKLIGVATDGYLRTFLLDLKRGTKRLVVDNTRNSSAAAWERASISNMPASGCGAIGVVEVCGTALFFCSIRGLCSRRRRHD